MSDDFPEILQDVMPVDAIAYPLPGTRPMEQDDWLRRDERFAEQMALRDRLIAERREAVIATRPEAEVALAELYATVLAEVGATGSQHTRPDGVTVPLDPADPLATVGRLAQEDFLVHLRGPEEHWLAAGVLCFPSRWTLAEKMGRPLTGIHIPVPQYDDNLARRVQRLFDGVQPDRPIVRWNRLPYRTAELHNPQREADSAATHAPDGPRPFLRQERQAIRKLPATGAVIFSIHTYLVRA
ncbi:DUF3445 domain-containing protein [Maritimibacter sp. DP1N21-5]|uniref:heme-dependent oxidative N-demethylase family protein n=1 Tax=Maritimibacter sp. DP1N21-5 TaxID=2836867 RepID=UPI001C4751E4|nr:DUF3445 domain-containing protein [Maritimibacter sp. DP1N21-5]MBV7407574.1 DUF3445 domain-containing protein [Maritimibacter sp. DP1N21-5]